ncbi:MAG: hypothetical protein ACD_12C00155G0003 [uncultured bacterium]|uniref:Ribbon-helix-helix protein CopG domain-containing protein n=1 Tax=Berkelbacteria bacterium GW2011_GWA2_38_9 TaxID=1618334 RepID=A0A0G0LHD1_9BACT|nr:MAG: hypothetical protein ACD_12C00155G0003 [uncultured bacterium]KKQ90472.1 MAG: hypothetical protein UT11_C0005G0013 [Berkelbacteria bacterium GW2011_GWA2_38_9]
MSIVNFTIPSTLEQRVSRAIKTKGFSSKAEFFRMAVISFIDDLDDRQLEDKRFEILSKSLSNEISKKYRGKYIPTIQEQLSDL